MHIIESKQKINNEEVAIYIEVDNLPFVKSPYENVRGGEATKEVITAAGDLFGDAMKLTRNCAKQIVDSVKKMDEAIRPEEFEVKLAIKLDAEVGAVIAKASTGAQIEVTMKWKPREES